jgi:cytosine/adenosine deaminase-related metal-dependent hydrolase
VHEDKIKDTLSTVKTLREDFRNAGMKATITPHAPYSTPPSLMKEIANYFDKNDELLSIHIQETAEENELFENKSGKFLEWLISINASSKIWKNRNKSLDVLEELENKKILLVHNTYTSKKDVDWAAAYNNQLYYCTCPKANLYIENALPDYSIFDTNKLCIGTDSLASNDSLSILEELLVIQENSNFDFNTLLKIASKNGAEFLGFENLGTFEKGKIPGVNLIIDFSENKITKLI